MTQQFLVFTTFNNYLKNFSTDARDMIETLK